ncbi:MAG: serine/threonine protein kinase [Deltaproteobacteria bacterium]|nr:serine/threonine protein kinase [Deltaproteobacteria bacterium]
MALKRLLPKHTHDPHVVRMFLEEMGVAAQLSHPHIVVTYDFGELDGAYFLAMEYVDGLALDRLVAEQGPLPLDAVVTLGRHIASALQHAHERVSAGAPTPVVHQDVTPHNILVSRAGDAKLLDFGIARTEAAALGERVHAKVRYAAPEQLRRAPPDRRFDVWGLGSRSTRPSPAGSRFRKLTCRAGSGPRRAGTSCPSRSSRPTPPRWPTWCTGPWPRDRKIAFRRRPSSARPSPPPTRCPRPGAGPPWAPRWPRPPPRPRASTAAR